MGRRAAFLSGYREPPKRDHSQDFRFHIRSDIVGDHCVFDTKRGRSVFEGTSQECGDYLEQKQFACSHADY